MKYNLMKDKEDGHRFFNRNWVNFLEKCSDFLCCLFCSFFLKAFVCLRHQRLSSQSLNSSQDVDLWRNGKQSKKITWAHPCYIRTAANMTPAGATVPGLGPMSLGGWTSKVERCVCMCVCVCACACLALLQGTLLISAGSVSPIC